jgi:hypothetical protein
VLLTPRRARDWGWAERTLEGLGCLVVPATSAGVAGYAERLKSAGDAPLVHWVPSRNRRLDLPQRLEMSRDALLAEVALPPLAQRELLAELRAWLGADGFGLLQALAVFPRLEPELTQHLICELLDRASPVGARERTFLSVARLPWLRAGRLPDWLRRALIVEMQPAALAASLASVQRWLQPVSACAGTATMEIARRGLMDWIAGNPEAQLDDRIFISVLKGRSPTELSVEAPPDLREWARRRLSSPDWPPVAIGALAAACVAALHGQLLALAAAGVGALGLPELGRLLVAHPWLTAGAVTAALYAAALGWKLIRAVPNTPWRETVQELSRLAAGSPWTALPLLAALDLQISFGTDGYFAAGALIPGAGVVMAYRYGLRTVPVLAALMVLSLAHVQLSAGALSLGWGGAAGMWAAALLLARLRAEPHLFRRFVDANRLPVHSLALVFVVLGVILRGPSVKLPSASIELGWNPSMLQATVVFLIGLSSVPAWPTLACILAMSFPDSLLGMVERSSARITVTDLIGGLTLLAVFLSARWARRWLDQRRELRDFEGAFQLREFEREFQLRDSEGAFRPPSPWLFFVFGEAMGLASLAVLQLHIFGGTMEWSGLVNNSAMIAIVVLGGAFSGMSGGIAAASGVVTSTIFGANLGRPFYFLSGPVSLGLAPNGWYEVLNNLFLYGYVPLAITYRRNVVLDRASKTERFAA